MNGTPLNSSSPWVIPSSPNKEHVEDRGILSKGQFTLILGQNLKHQSLSSISTSISRLDVVSSPVFEGVVSSRVVLKVLSNSLVVVGNGISIISGIGVSSAPVANGEKQTK